jgi:MFS family permease
MFASLRQPSFRWLWFSLILGSGTMQMEGVASGWLVYELTGSGFALGWVSAGWSVSTLTLSLFGGALSDRLEKRDMIAMMRFGQMLNTVLIIVLVLGGWIQVWHLAVCSLLSGVFFAFMMPAQNALVAELIDRQTLLNAVSLNSVGMGLMGIATAALAGYAIDAWGIGAVYAIVALFYAAMVVLLLKLPRSSNGRPAASSVVADMRAGLSYLRTCPIIYPLLGMVLLRGLLAMPYRTMMPKYAADVMGFGAEGLGWLTAARGAGSLVSALVLASLGDFRRKGKLLLMAAAAMGVSIVVWANVPVYAIVLLFLAITDGLGNTCMVTNQTLLQMSCAGAYRGRVMSLYMMMFGVTQLAGMPIGALADAMGIQWVLTLQGLLLTASFAAVFLFMPRLRRLA